MSCALPRERTECNGCARNEVVTTVWLYNCKKFKTLFILSCAGPNFIFFASAHDICLIAS
jgi:hypothetical protein